MMIWKFGLAVEDRQIVMMPDGAHILSIQTQGDGPQLWAMVDESAPSVQRAFATYGTGHPMPSTPGQHQGTYQLGPLVFHVFEVPP